MTQVAVIGLGAMGARMAQRLLDEGHVLSVFNRTPSRAARLVEQGARLADSPYAAAAGAEVVISMVTDDDASRAVWLGDRGALAAMREGAIAIESSTLTPGCVTALAAAARAAGVALLDAPVAGSRPQAEAGQLIYLVGGEPSVLEQARPLLEVMGGAVHHAGPVGAGAVMKLALNSLFGVQVVAMAEALAMCARHDVAPARALELLGQMPVTSPAAAGVGGLIVAERWAPMFPVVLVEKDLAYMVEAAGAPADGGATLVDAARQRFRAAREAGFGGENLHAVAKLYRAA